MPELKPEGFVEAVRKVVQTLRYGPRELTLATFGLLLLALPKALPEPLPKALDFLKPVLAWIPWAGVLLLAVAAWLIWKKVVAPIPEGKPKPPAIKGPAPFDPNDAELFARLGRKDDLDRLRAWILDDQKPLVALMGESGVGKTSLLRAGLENHLKGDAVQVIYWEALPTEPEEGLLHAVQSRWGDPTTAPTSFARLASAVARGKRVVVIDQAEQLSPERHRAVFEMLRQVATANPPYSATWVVAFRREYLPVWRDFELALPEPAQRRMDTLSLRRFLPEQAERVIAVLAEEGGVPLEQRVVKVLVESLESEGRVTPADIGISLLVLSEISSNAKDSAFTIEEFRERGGQAGLLTQYLERLLEPFPEAERREIFLSLLSLINPDTDQRLAEGRTPLELEASARPASPPRFAAMLRFLASGKARILEEVPEPPLRFRLIHERLIPAIRRLTGILGAEAEQAGRLLERAYRIWTRDRKARYLLSGQELRQVQRFRGQLPWGDQADQKRDYLDFSRQRRNRVWVSVWVSSTIALTSAGLVIYLYSEHRGQVAADRTRMTFWQLPPDLPDHLEQLEELTLPKGVTQFDWLKKAHRLQSLEIAEDLGSGEELPKDLRTLKLMFDDFSVEPRSRKAALMNLPKGLITLEIYGCLEWEDFGSLPKNLLRLSINFGFSCRHTIEGRALSAVRLPSSLRSLEINFYPTPLDKVFIDFSYLSNLRTLSFRAFPSDPAIQKYFDNGNVALKLPGSIRSLGTNAELSLNDLPAELESLTCSCNPDPKLLPRGLKRLTLYSREEKVKVTSSPLYSLAVSDQLDQLSLMTGLLELTLRGPLKVLPQLPPSLTKLRILSAGESSVDFLHFPLNLIELTIHDSNINFTKGLPVSLKALALDEKQAILPKLPEGLASLVYTGPLHAPLPASLRSLTIRVDDQHLGIFASLWALNDLRLQGEVTKIPSQLNSLITLDIRETKIGSLKGLPRNLISLTLRPGQVKTLEGLPKSVTSLHFRASNR